MKPGDTVEFTLTFTGKLVRARGKYVVVRTNRGSHQIPVDNIVRVIDPEPDEAEVIKIARCSACDRTPGVSCVHKQTGKPVKHPHKERVQAYVEATGWTPK